MENGTPSTLGTCAVQGQAKGLVSGNGGNFDKFADKQFICKFPCCNFLTVSILSNIIIKIAITTTNQHFRLDLIIRNGVSGQNRIITI